MRRARARHARRRAPDAPSTASPGRCCAPYDRDAWRPGAGARIAPPPIPASRAAPGGRAVVGRRHGAAGARRVDEVPGSPLDSRPGGADRDAAAVAYEAPAVHAPPRRRASRPQGIGDTPSRDRRRSRPRPPAVPAGSRARPRPRRPRRRASATAAACAAACATCAASASSASATSAASSSTSTASAGRTRARARQARGAARPSTRELRALEHALDDRAADHRAARARHLRVPALRRAARQRRALLPVVRHSPSPAPRAIAAEVGEASGRAPRPRTAGRDDPHAPATAGTGASRRAPADAPASRPTSPSARATRPVTLATPADQPTSVARSSTPAEAPRAVRCRARIRCPRCGRRSRRDQDWCLDCGAAARTRLVPTPNWRLPHARRLVATSSLLVIALVVRLARDDAPVAARARPRRPPPRRRRDRATPPRPPPATERRHPAPRPPPAPTTTAPGARPQPPAPRPQPPAPRPQPPATTALTPSATASAARQRPSAPPAPPTRAASGGSAAAAAIRCASGAPEHLERRERRRGERLEVVAALEHHADAARRAPRPGARIARRHRARSPSSVTRSPRAGRARARRSRPRRAPAPGAYARRQRRRRRARRASTTAASPDPAGHRQVDRVALARPGARVGRRRPSRDTAATGGSSTNSTSRVAWKMSFVPLPWWTSQSRIRTRSAPWRRAPAAPRPRRC